VFTYGAHDCCLHAFSYCCAENTTIHLEVRQRLPGEFVHSCCGRPERAV